MTNTFLEKSETQKEFEEIYMNSVQMLATLVDPNRLLAEIGRAGGKTEGLFGPRVLRVAYSMPGEISFLCHSTYVALLTIIVPNLISYFKTPRGKEQKSLLEEGRHYVIGQKILPDHFIKPRYPVVNPKHSIVFHTGHVLQLVATDVPDSIAGANGVHAFLEEMKHQEGQKLRSRIFPALRSNNFKIRQSPYYQGITGISDTARVDLGENDWFVDYENQVDKELIKEILTVAIHVNKAVYNIERGKDIEKNQKLYNRWIKVLNSMRKSATLYIRASTFVNKDILGFEYFENQFKTLTMDEFLTSIGNIRPKKVSDMFFAKFDDTKHTFKDSYKYESILKLNLKDSFTIDASYLRNYNPRQKLILGYDPGGFSSLVVAQEKYSNNELLVLKEHFVFQPQSHADLARDFNRFFGKQTANRNLVLYYDRAGNQKRDQKQQTQTDAKRLEAELKKLGWGVNLMNLNQRTIFHYEHYNLLLHLLGEEDKHTPRIKICANECPNLISSIHLSPVKRDNGRIELDKTSEKKVPMENQAALTTQIPSALMYLIFGLYEKHLPEQMNRYPQNLPGNISL